MKTNIQAEYLWLDGAEPTQALRSKTRIIRRDVETLPSHDELPTWGFDGSSTNQASGGDSDLMLQPVRVVRDPIRGGSNIGSLRSHACHRQASRKNHRAALRDVLDRGADRENAWFGFEQEYTSSVTKHLSAGRAMDTLRLRDLSIVQLAHRWRSAERFVSVIRMLVWMRTLFFGTNAEVMPGQWEFQIGYRGDKDEEIDPLVCTDHPCKAGFFTVSRRGKHHGLV